MASSFTLLKSTPILFVVIDDVLNPSHSRDMKQNKPNKVSVCPAKTQISLGVHPVWTQTSLSAWKNIGSLAIHWAHSECSDKTGRMPRLIWVFAGRTCHFVDFVMLPLNIFSLFLLTSCLIRISAMSLTVTHTFTTMFINCQFWHQLKLMRSTQSSESKLGFSDCGYIFAWHCVKI